MKKKAISSLLAVLMLCGCTPKAAPGSSVQEQCSLIMDARPQWQQEESSHADAYYYTVTDLDHNGHLELFAASTQGTGIFTYGKFFEISEDYTALTECTIPLQEYDTLPEVICQSAPGCKDSDGRYHYLFNDSSRASAAEYGLAIVALSLHSGVLQPETLAWMYTRYTESGEHAEYHDPNGEITAEAFEHAQEAYCAGKEAFTVNLDWFSFQEDITAQRLLASYETFIGR